ncbi:MAG: flagellar biosynthesis protein FlgB [Oscillibacter sp.]|nr:flagellar biosynthesis protein FlgB [Oscillibacter sp.]
MDFLSSNSFMMLEKSMGFLWTKQASILDNIANAETPGYKPKVVTFEESLRGSLERARLSATPRSKIRRILEESEFAVEDQLESTRMDDNGVNVTEQSIEMIRNAYQIQYVQRAISSDLNILRAAIQG